MGLKAILTLVVSNLLLASVGISSSTEVKHEEPTILDSLLRTLVSPSQFYCGYVQLLIILEYHSQLDFL